MLCYRKAASKGRLRPNIASVFCITMARGSKKDLQQAAEWYKKAAEQGDTSAQAALGNMYLAGEGVPRDSAKAAYWHKKSLKLKKPITNLYSPSL